jgi:serine/threonine protein kinase
MGQFAADFFRAMLPLDSFCVDLREYAKVGKIGSGGFSSVKQYRRRRDGRLFAVKTIDREVEKPWTQQMFFRELTILIALRHPAVLHLEGFALPCGGELGNKLRIVTDLMPHGNLQDQEERAASGSPSPEFDATRKSILLFGTAVAMRYIHELHIVHRDLKAGNIFLDEHWEPRVADFGLSKVIDRKLVMSGALGTPYYMAPELFDPSSCAASYPLDVYAFGVIILSLWTNGVFNMTGTRALSIPMLASALQQGRRFQIPGYVPPRFEQLISVCWEQSPTDRPTFADIVQILSEDDMYIPGTDVEAFNEYRARIGQWRPDDVSVAKQEKSDVQPYDWDAVE